MKSIISIILGLVIYAGLSAQKPAPDFWEEKPTYTILAEEFAGKKAVYQKLLNSYNFWYDESGTLKTDYIYYRKVRVNEEETINEFNKIYIPVSPGDELVEVKARSINPNGTIVEFDTKNIRELDKEEGDGSYKIFAIDGVEKGSDVEAYFCKRSGAVNFGSIYYQYSYPLIKGEFIINSPTNLFYSVKGYNGFPETKYQKLEEDNFYRAEVKGVAPIKDEEYSYTDQRRIRLEFKLDVNTVQGKYPLFTWDNAAANIHQVIYTLDKKETKTIEKLASRFKPEEKNLLQQVKSIERYIKHNINIMEYSIPDFSNLEYVVNNNVSDEAGLTRLYANLFRYMGIKHNVGITIGRDRKLFDPGFQSYNFLNTYIIYLPDLNMYLEPGSTESFVYCFPGTLTATWGLFLEEVHLKNYTGVIGTTRYIEPSPFNVNNHNSYIKLLVDPEEGIAEVETEDCFRGLGGGILDEYYNLVADENREEFLRQVLLVDLPDEDLTYIGRGSNDGRDSINKPEFVISFKASTKKWVDIAGRNILVKLGETIGPQVEMYQSEERESGVENEFNRWYYREIEFKVPDGYRIKNPEVARFDIIYNDGENNIYGFESDYEQTGNLYKVTINEYYKEIFVGKEHFEEFRKVVNAAADFNKVVLILERIAN